MTSTTTTEESRAPATARLRDVVGLRVASLQRAVLADEGAARATVARLRSAVTKAPGSEPAIWEVTSIYADPRGLPDEPTSAESAAHLSLCLWALHQQSRSEPMHVAGRSFPRSVAELARRNATSDTDPVRRRFDAVATATDVAETAHHLRGLVAQLRAAGIPLDYGLLAEDLDQLRAPRGRDRVLRRWGRDYHDRPPAPTSNPEPATNTTEAPTTQEH